MKLTKESIEKTVTEELEKFLESNPQFSKMMKAHAQSDAARDFKQDDQEQKRAEKAKQFRQAQRGASGARNLELNEGNDGDLRGALEDLVSILLKRDILTTLESIDIKRKASSVTEQSKFPKTTPPKTSEKSSKMISNAVNTAKDKKKGEQK